MEVTIDDRDEFCESLLDALYEHLTNRIDGLTTKDFLVVDKALRCAADVLFLENVMPASTAVH